ncbi:MAG: hypothetical protein AAFP19_23690 [Bacteroidota bacterium]
MPKRIICLLLLLLPLLAKGQSPPSFQELVQQTNQYLERYSYLYPFGDPLLAMADYLPTPQERAAFLSDLGDDTEGLSEQGDSVLTSYLIWYYQDLIINHLDQLIRHEQLGEQDLLQLIDSDSDLAISRSEDGKLYNFSLDERTGGSYRSRVSWMHYTDLKEQEASSTEKIDPFEVFHRDGYTQIHSLPTAGPTYYLVIGYVRGCNYCFEDYLKLVHFEAGRFVEDFAYAVEASSGYTEMTYTPEDQGLHIQYETNEQIPDCICEEEEEEGLEDRPFQYQECECFFKFNGQSFDFVKKNRRLIKD